MRVRASRSGPTKRSYLKFSATVIVGLGVVGGFSALLGIGLLNLLAARDTPVASVMLALGAAGLVVLRIVGKRALRHLPEGREPYVPAPLSPSGDAGSSTAAGRDEAP
jgi:hypothetical protein